MTTTIVILASALLFVTGLRLSLQNDSQIILLRDGWVNCGSNLRPVEVYELQLHFFRV